MTHEAPVGPARGKDGDPLGMTQVEKLYAQWEARHDVAARGHHASPTAVQQYLSRAHLEESLPHQTEPHSGATDEDPGASGDGTPRRVVVGVDGSAGSRAALLAAVAAAVRRGADVEVVSAYSVVLPWTRGAPVVASELDAPRRSTESLARAFLAGVLKDAGLIGSDTVTIRVVAAGGPAAQVLVNRSQQADLLVVGSRGRGAMRSALLGSVALHCITHAHCPVEVVHEAVTGEPGRIVVGVDGSPASQAALRAAVDEAARTGAELEAVGAFSVGEYWPDSYAAEQPIRDETRAELQESTEGLLQQAIGEARTQAGTVRSTCTVVEGPAAEVLIKQGQGADLLVVGSRGHNTIGGLLLGSVALRCAMHAPCPVLVVHPEHGQIHDDAGPAHPAVAHT